MPKKQFDQNKYIQQFMKEKEVHKRVVFNKETDADLLAWLDGKTFSTYVKDLIRRDKDEPIDAYKIVFNRVNACEDCNTCGKRMNCEYIPRPGETTRINCPLWESK